MDNNQSQVGSTPSEPFCYNNTNELNINQMLSIELITATQPFIPLNTTNMIPTQRQFISNVPLHNNLTIRQFGRRRRCQRRRERRRQRREEQRRQEQQRRAENQAQEPVIHVRRKRSRISFEIEWDHDNCGYFGFPEYMDEAYNDPLLEAYEWETMHPKERWEQEQLNEFEQFAGLEQLALIQDELEQQRPIDKAATMLREQQGQQNQEQLIHHEQWENAAFIVQQLNEN